MGVAVFDDVTNQIDGITDTFTLQAVAVEPSVCIGYNGQVHPPGYSIDSFPTTSSVKLTFVPTMDADPELHTKLMIIYNEDSGSSDLTEIQGSATPPGVP